STITKLNEDEHQKSIQSVELTNHRTGEVTNLPIDDVIINHGYERDSALLDHCSLDIKRVHDYYIEGTSKSQTYVDGLYAAEDIMKYDGKVDLIAGAFQDEINAVNKSKLYIQPDANDYAMVSSHNEVFNQKNKKLMKQ